jgi:murein DD-endopeptidase MepM/ murein hydrolase activator NlpD
MTSRFYCTCLLLVLLQGCASPPPIKAARPDGPGATFAPRGPAEVVAGQSSELFSWPVSDAKFSRGFAPHGTKKQKRPHLGIDLAAPKNTPILAAQDGVVIYAGKDFHGYGLMIMIEGHGGFATLYAHLNKALAKDGQHVKRGQQIGLMGRTGRATGVNLHFEIRKDLGPVDPLLYLPQPMQDKVSIRAPSGSLQPTHE